MNKPEAQQLIYNALIAYVDDCAGRDSEEAKQLEQAWELVKNPQLTIEVPIAEDELERLQHEDEEFEWNFPTEEDPDQNVKIIVKKES
jgi:hypothetical protein